MADYVTRCYVAINGQDFEHFKAFREKEREVAKQINLMNGTGRSKSTPRYQIELDYVIPATGTEYDFDALENATVTVEKQGGRRLVFSGVGTLTVGESVIDNENEEVRTILMHADTRKEE